MAPIQRDGMEYEFDVVGDMDLDHNLLISKSRCSALADAVISKPGAKVAETLRVAERWCGRAEARRFAARPSARAAPGRRRVARALRALKQVETSEDLHAWTRDAAPLLVAVDGVTREKATSKIIKTGEPLGVEGVAGARVGCALRRRDGGWCSEALRDQCWRCAAPRR